MVSRFTNTLCLGSFDKFYTLAVLVSPIKLSLVFEEHNKASIIDNPIFPMQKETKPNFNNRHGGDPNPIVHNDTHIIKFPHFHILITSIPINITGKHRWPDTKNNRFFIRNSTTTYVPSVINILE